MRTALTVSKKYPLKTLADLWLDYQRLEVFTDKTIATNKDKIYKFIWWCENQSITDPLELSTDHARRFTYYLKTPQPERWGIKATARRPSKLILAADTVKSYGRCVKAFFNWLESEGYVPASPFNHKSISFATRQDPRPKLRTVGREELIRVVSFLARDKTFVGKRDLAIVALLLDTGIRRGELINLKLSDVDLTGKLLVNGKTGARYAYFAAPALAALNNYLKSPIFDDAPQNCPLWLGMHGAPLEYNSVNHIFRRIAKGTGVTFHAHQLRHTFASMMAADGTDAFTLKELLGHQSVTTTEIYVNMNEETLKKAQRKSSPLQQVAGVSLRGKGRPRK